ncbi:hypothetical protein SKAU_G00301890 [Synaphobranchus kaupii]|uniref:Uncharacterized protein n=1 Tax=Synaphobranchus kaupii TaxID=118154 RepID=A0A9Q1EVS4_SYNKA|nr:hypothetical protein SKAU_G00301890 [Synaphobranchus kaupii]
MLRLRWGASVYRKARLWDKDFEQGTWWGYISLLNRRASRARLGPRVGRLGASAALCLFYHSEPSGEDRDTAFGDNRGREMAAFSAWDYESEPLLAVRGGDAEQTPVTYGDLLCQRRKQALARAREGV